MQNNFFFFILSSQKKSENFKFHYHKYFQKNCMKNEKLQLQWNNVTSNEWKIDESETEIFLGILFLVIQAKINKKWSLYSLLVNAILLYEFHVWANLRHNKQRSSRERETTERNEFPLYFFSRFFCLHKWNFSRFIVICSFLFGLFRFFLFFSESSELF